MYFRASLSQSKMYIRSPTHSAREAFKINTSEAFKQPFHLGRVRISTLRNENETFSQLNSITYIGVFLRLVTYSHLP